MLISHKNKFIFTKTEKTAGSTIEAYFEPYCMPNGEGEFKEIRDQYNNKESGIIGARCRNASRYYFYEHMPAKSIKQKVSDKIWEDYFKFTIIRNPFDKIVSYFHHLRYIFMNREFYELTHRRKFHRFIWELQIFRSKDVIKQFRQWVNREYFLDKTFGGLYSGFVNDRNKYIIDGEFCMDYVIRMEDLHKGLEHVCLVVDVPYEPKKLLNLKSGIRSKNLKYTDYYDRATAKKVANKYEYELKQFGYPDISKLK